MPDEDPAWIVDGYVNANPPHLGLDWTLTDDLYGANKARPHDLEGLLADMDRPPHRACAAGAAARVGDG